MDPLEIALCTLKTIAFQGLSPCSELAQKALDKIKELKEPKITPYS